MSETHTMVFEKAKDGWRGWIDAFPTTRVEAATKYEVEEALELLWVKLLTRKMFESEPSERTKPFAVALMSPVDEN